MMRNDRFTDQAQTVLQQSQQVVRDQRHSQWDVEHVFLALVQLKDGLARDVLTGMGVDVDALSPRIADHLHESPKPGYAVVPNYPPPPQTGGPPSTNTCSPSSGWETR